MGWLKQLGAAGLAAAAAAAAEVLPPEYICQRTESPITVDGRADEPVWQLARVLSPLRDIEGGAAANGTQIRMLWDDRYLYIHADIPEEHLRATQTERDSIIFRDPDFEVFIDPYNEGQNYVELEINALNTVWDLFVARTYRCDTPVILHDWNMAELRHAVHLRGTLNNAADTDSGWSVELAIPWRSISGNSIQPRTDSCPTPGSSMRFNFSCVNRAVQADAASPSGYSPATDAAGKPLPEINHVWAPTGRVNIHLPEYWGRVTFSPQPAGTWESLPPDAESAARIALYRYAEAQQEYRHAHSRYAATAAEQAAAGLCTPQGVQAEVEASHFFLSSFCARSGRRLELDSAWQFRAVPLTLPLPQVYLWVHGEDAGNTALWQQRFADYAAAGVDTVIIGDTAEQVRTLAPLARAAGLRVVAWLWSLNRPQDAEPLRHPDWFAVSAEGKSCHTEHTRPYVPYYQFLCPNHAEVRAYLLQQVDALAAVPEVEGIQLDYMRLPDVILPHGLWKKYGLIMDSELPPFDFCYCPVCRRLFTEQQRQHPAQDVQAAWREFRLQSVAALAGALCDRVRAHGKTAACAVFPSPQLAARLVRQDWGRFPLDVALPMAYHSFYDEGQGWITRICREAAEQTQNRIPLAPGLHLPDFTPQDFRRTLEQLRTYGVHGIGLFSSETFTPEFQSAFRAWKERRE